MPTICVVRGAAPLVDFISELLCLVIGHRQKKKKMWNQKRSSSFVVRQNNNYFLMRSLCLCLPVPVHASHHCIDFLMKCIWNSNIEVVANVQMHFVRSFLCHISLFGLGSSRHLWCAPVPGLLSCVKQTMRTLGHALIVNEYLCSRYVWARVHERREIILRLLCYVRPLSTISMETMRTSIVEFNAFKASHPEVPNTRSTNHRQRAWTIRQQQQ